MNTKPILLVEDNPDDEALALRAFSKLNISNEILVARDGIEALDYLFATGSFTGRDPALLPAVILLDLKLPRIDGLEVLRRIRTTSNVPVLMLSAKGDEIDRVVGLEIGADDYITKPFAMRELIARIRAIVRRMGMNNEPPELRQPEPAVQRVGSELLAGPLVIDTAARTVTKNGESVELNPKEFDLLAYFAKHPGVVMSRDALLREVWGYEYRVDTRTVDVHVRWLRTKLESNPAIPEMLITVRGSGYRFVPDGPDS